MEISYAPMEGITTPLFRTLHRKFFTGVDKYYTPFISTGDSVRMNNREKEDADPSFNPGIDLVPQIISNSASQSVVYITHLGERYGHKEVNINLGCPSGTVVSKGKGSGMLRDKDVFEEYLSSLKTGLSEKEKAGEKIPQVSLKTRIGFYSEDEFREVARIIEAYRPFKVIVHPRSRKSMYQGTPDMDAFSYMYDAFRSAGIGVVYNGDIKTPEDCERLIERFPELSGVMIGRGLLRDPALARRIKGGSKAEPEEILTFMETVLDSYTEKIGTERFVLAKMKDLWAFMFSAFAGNEKGYRDMCKARTVEEYRVCTRQFVRNSEYIL